MPSVRLPLLIALSAALMASVCPAVDKPPVVPKQKITKWVLLYDLALQQAHKEKKFVLAYFSGSDWEEYTKKIEHDVLNTDMFRDWAADRVVLLRVDFTRDKPLSVNIKAQNDKLKKQYSIVKVPTFILMDSSGLPFMRAGYDEAKLRDDEPKDTPKGWLKYLDDAIKNRPPDEELVKQKNLTECIAFGKKHFISSVIMISQGTLARTMGVKEDLIRNQAFVRYLNHNVSFTDIEWPADSDNSAEGNAVRTFIASQGIGSNTLQLVIYDMQTKKVKAKIVVYDNSRVEQIISSIQAQLPRLDYNGGWIEDYRQAQAVAQQQNRYIFIAFTALDGSEAANFSKKMYEEIFDTDEFKLFAHKKLVLLRVDFPSPSATQPTTQSASLASQNKILAEMFAIRGYPSIVVMNPQGQKIGDSKYMKGGVGPFLKNLGAAVKIDEDKRALLMGDQADRERERLERENAEN